MFVNKHFNYTTKFTGSLLLYHLIIRYLPWPSIRTEVNHFIIVMWRPGRGRLRNGRLPERSTSSSGPRLQPPISWKSLSVLPLLRLRLLVPLATSPFVIYGSRSLSSLGLVVRRWPSGIGTRHTRDSGFPLVSFLPRSSLEPNTVAPTVYPDNGVSCSVETNRSIDSKLILYIYYI